MIDLAVLIKKIRNIESNMGALHINIGELTKKLNLPSGIKSIEVEKIMKKLDVTLRELFDERERVEADIVRKFRVFEEKNR